MSVFGPGMFVEFIQDKIKEMERLKEISFFLHFKTTKNFKINIMKKPSKVEYVSSVIRSNIG